MKKRLICAFLSIIMVLLQGTAVLAADTRINFENPGFEDGIRGWYFNGNGYNISNVQSTEGANSLKFYHQSLTYAKAMHPIRVQKNKTYQISFDAKASSGSFYIGVSAQSTTLSQIFLGSSGGSWMRYSLAFSSGENENAVFYIKNIALPSEPVYFDQFEITETEENLFVNGDFEEGKKGWERETFNVLGDGAYQGTQYAAIWGAGSYIYQTIPVKKHTEYNLSFAYKSQNPQKSNKLRIVAAGMAGLDKDGNAADGASLVGEGKKGKLYDVSTGWQRVEETIQTGDNETIYIVVIHDYTYGYDGFKGPFVDDFCLSPVVRTNLIVNGGFESGKDGWDRETFNVVQGDAYEGEQYAAHWGAGSFMYQRIPVERNTEYTLSFAYKNQNPEHSNKLRIVVTGNQGLNENGRPNEEIYLLGDTENRGNVYEIVSDWTKVTETVSTGENDEIYLCIIHDYTYGYDGYKGPLFDDFSLTPKRANMLINGGFESGRCGWERVGYNIVSKGTDEDGMAARFWGVDFNIYQKLKVKRNVDYKLTFSYKNDNLDQSNRLRLVVGTETGIDDVGAPLDGFSLLSRKENTGREKPGVLYPLKTEWTDVEEVFNSGDHDEIYLVFIHDNTYSRNYSGRPMLDDVTLLPAEYTYPDTDFENAELGEWDSVGASEVSENGAEGEHSVLLFSTMNTDWVKLSKKVSVEKQKNYRLLYWYQNEDYGHDLSIYDQSFGDVQTSLDNEGELVESDLPVQRIQPMTLHREHTDGWTHTEQSFNSGDNRYVTIEFSGSNANKRSKFYLDGIRLLLPQPAVERAEIVGAVVPGVPIRVRVTIEDGGDTVSEIQYQWQRSSDGAEWQNIDGANRAEYIPEETDADQKIRLKITPIGEMNPGDPYYTRFLEANSLAEFEKWLIREINYRMEYVPGWLDSRYEEYIDELLSLCSMAEEYGIVLSQDRISSWNTFLLVTSRISKVDSIVQDTEHPNAVIIRMAAPLAASELARFRAETKEDTPQPIQIAAVPLEVVSYTVNSKEEQYVKSFRLSLSGSVDACRLYRETAYGSCYEYDIILEKLVSVQNVTATLSRQGVTTTAEVENKKSDTPLAAAVFAAVYDSSGRLVGAAVQNCTLTKNAEAMHFTKTIPVKTTEGLTAKIYVWDQAVYFPYSSPKTLSVAVGE